jgi:hypothetical protein
MIRETARVRKNGTVVTVRKMETRFAACRGILANQQYPRWNMVDLFSPRFKVYDSNDANKAKFKALPVARMASIAFKLLAKPPLAADLLPPEYG